MARVTGLFHPPITTDAPSEAISLAALTPVAGLLWSSLATTCSWRPSTPPDWLTRSAWTWIAFNTSSPFGPAGPLNGTITPILMGPPDGPAGTLDRVVSVFAHAVAAAKDTTNAMISFVILIATPAHAGGLGHVLPRRSMCLVGGTRGRQEPGWTLH